MGRGGEAGAFQLVKTRREGQAEARKTRERMWRKGNPSGPFCLAALGASQGLGLNSAFMPACDFGPCSWPAGTPTSPSGGRAALSTWEGAMLQLQLTEHLPGHSARAANVSLVHLDPLADPHPRGIVTSASFPGL